MSKNYRDYLIKTAVNLDVFASELYSSIVNLAMSGEFAELDVLFEEGESVYFNLTDFENVVDRNVQELINLLRISYFTAKTTLPRPQGPHVRPIG